MAPLARVGPGTPGKAPRDDAQVFLDEPELAGDLEYFRLGSLSFSNGASLLTYSTDTDGSEQYTLEIKDLATGELLPRPD